jgi:vacuolar iron transporter family protein
VAQLITTSKKSWIRTMVEKELGVSIERVHNEKMDALVMGISYLFGSLFPIIPYTILSLHNALFVSIGLTVVALFGLGMYKSKVANGNILMGGIEVMSIGAFSGIAGYLLGTLLPGFLHLAGIT